MAPRLSGLSCALASSVLVVAAVLCLSVPADVHATERSDAWITTKIKIALLTTRDVSSRDIHVDTVDGRVSLYGTVSSPTERVNAERSVNSVEGRMLTCAPMAWNRPCLRRKSAYSRPPGLQSLTYRPRPTP